MVVIRCTGKLLKRMRLAPNPESPESTTRLGNWYANVVDMRGGELILCVSEVTLLPVVLPIVDVESSFSARLAACLEHVLSRLGIDAAAAQAEVNAMADATYSTTSSRRVLGSMNDFWNLLDGYWSPRADLTNVALRIADAPCSPLGMESPRCATLAVFGMPGAIANDV
jgi:hypothetical protein